MPIPTSLLARTSFVLAVSAFAIAVTAVVALQIFVITPMSAISADDEAGLLALSAQTWVELPEYTRPAFELEMAQVHDLIISSDVRELRPAASDVSYFSLLEERLVQRIGESVRLLEGDGLLWAEIPIPGGPLQIGFSPQRREVQPLYVGLLIVGMGAAIVFATSFFIVRGTAAPLADTASAVEAFRGAGGFSPLPEKGPRELVTLAESFNRMAREISELLLNRTTLLAGISHDLRTPLARMRLALELLPDDVDRNLVGRMERNLESMDELIGDALRFARGAGEVPQEVLLKPYVESVVTNIDETIGLVWRGNEDVCISLAPGAFTRVLTNLISNAQQHAEGACVVVEVNMDITVHVVDRGPGIPKKDREKVLQPFYRLERSRSQRTGGSGLGLAIVSSLCQAHGWRVKIDASEAGGTDAWVSIANRMQS
jgi:two-component system osmolarity sensor histidine kinase EnvZ